MNIGGVEIGSGHPPYIIAEVSGEHCGSHLRCKCLIDEAKKAGADAVKFQCFDPEKLAEARGGKDKVLTEGLWVGRTLGDLYRQTYTPREWFPEFFRYTRSIGITLFSSVFDEEGVDYLETLGCPAYKIASPEITAHRLLQKVAQTRKPVVVSTGMASDEDIRLALCAMLIAEPPSIVRCPDVALLHCVSAYPCAIEDARLGRIRELMKGRTIPVGLSDHTLGSVAPIIATALGASIIEKHITLSRADGGPDAAFSLEPAEFKQMVSDVKDAYASLGSGERPKSEEMYRSLRRTSD